MRRRAHPSFPSEITCCFFSVLKTLLMPSEPIRALSGVNVPGFPMAGFQLTLYGRIWATPEVHRPRLQGIHSHRRDDACANIALLSAIEWQTGALAQILKVGVHSAWHTVDQGRCIAPDSNLRAPLQHRTLAQRHRLCDTARHARRPTS